MKQFAAMVAMACLTLMACQTEKKPFDPSTAGPLFKLHPAEKSGIIFNNAIHESGDLNYFKWAHVYSGAGVAVMDINNDGLPDIFFAGNQVGDRLYLNEGNFKFKDISESAGILQDGLWSTGVSYADVNADGFVDFYVCRNGASFDAGPKRNLLYINNGDLTFSERSKAYGLDDYGFSIQSVFFDMDKDGDLDMFLANQPPDPRVVQRHQLRPEQLEGRFGDKLFRNVGGDRFVEISKASGVQGHGYGLNAVASDIDQDGWVDLYVSNDYDEPDFMYMNNGDLTFRNTIHESVRHISNFAMGSDVADYNNDGLPDIVVVDMAAEDHFRSKTNMGSMRPSRFWSAVENGYHYQYMFNTLQLNNGNGSFSEVAQMAGIAKTDWSWSVLLADLDNDAHKDIFITNGIKRDMRNNDFRHKIKAFNERGQNQFVVEDVLKLVPSVKLENYAYRNNGDLTFTNESANWGVDQAGFSHGMALGDLDGDGDLDLVVNNVDDPAFIYENVWGDRRNYVQFDLHLDDKQRTALNARVALTTGDQAQYQELIATRGYMSASEDIIHFGLGDATAIDEVEITWPDGKRTILRDVEANRRHVINYQEVSFDVQDRDGSARPVLFSEVDQGLDHHHVENEFDDYAREILLPHKQSQNGPCVANGDVNGDGLDDVFIGGAAGMAGALYLQQADGAFRPSATKAWVADRASEDLGSLFFDADGDGDMDLYVTSGGAEYDAGDARYQDRLYVNDGNGIFRKDNGALPKFYESTERVILGDYDGDGDGDLFVGGRLVPGKYPSAANSYLLRNDGGRFVDATEDVAPGLRQLGLVTDALFTDYDQDDDADLLIVGEWMPITIFENRSGRLDKRDDLTELSDTRAWWWSVGQGDLDGDGDMDYVVGNLGRNTKFKAAPKKPFCVLRNDFDENGTNDIVLAGFYKDKLVPVRGRECTSEQMPFVAEKYPTFEEFASASIEHILPAEKMADAERYEVRSFQSVILWNDNGTFRREALPGPCQFAPIQDLLIEDVNGDGHLDVIGAGNLHAVEVETVRYDAGIGFYLEGQGDGRFAWKAVGESGFYAPHDARDLALLRTADQGRLILVANNDGPIQLFRI